jgi:hypothetical protein
MKTTCSMSDGSPGCCGTARDTLLRANVGGAPADAKCRRLFDATAVVNATKSAAVGMGSTFTEPRLACT